MVASDKETLVAWLDIWPDER